MKQQARKHQAWLDSLGDWIHCLVFSLLHFPPTLLSSLPPSFFPSVLYLALAFSTILPRSFLQCSLPLCSSPSSLALHHFPLREYIDFLFSLPGPAQQPGNVRSLPVASTQLRPRVYDARSSRAVHGLISSDSRAYQSSPPQPGFPLAPQSQRDRGRLH